MVTRKIITIKNDVDEQEFRDIITKVKFYKLSKAITIDPNSDKLPELYKDINENIVFCGLNEITSHKISQISEALFEAQKQFISAYSEFEKRVFEIETQAKYDIDEISNEYCCHENCTNPKQIFDTISVKFSNQDGEANIAMRLSFAGDKSKVEPDYPVNPQTPPPIYLETDPYDDKN